MLLKGDTETKLLNDRVLSDLVEQLSELLRGMLELGVWKRRTRLAVKCAVCLTVTGGLSGVSRTSVSERAVEIPTGEYFHSLSMRNKSEWA